MYLLMILYKLLLFILLTPGVLVTLPSKSSKYIVAATHGAIFIIVYHFTHKLVWQMTSGYESFKEAIKDKKNKK